LIRHITGELAAKSEFNNATADYAAIERDLQAERDMPVIEWRAAKNRSLTMVAVRHSGTNTSSECSHSPSGGNLSMDS
jgi:hypothetical protein